MHLLALRMFPRVGLLDFPERYHLLRKRLPYPTGVLALTTFLIVFALLNQHTFSMQDAGLMIGIVLLGTSCFIDDRRQLSPKIRLLLQVIVAVLLFATGSRIYTITNPLASLMSDPFLKLDTWLIEAPIFGSLPVWSGMFTVAWLLLTINALNWFDGIPGQVSLLSVIGFLTIGFLSLSLRVNQPDLALIAFILAGIAGACFLFDVPPPRVVMGDSGSMFFGLMLGTLTIYSGGKVATAFLVLGVPLIDSFFVTIKRVLSGRSPFKGSQSGEHLHHRLLARGWSPAHIIMLTASIGLLFGGTALFMSSFEKAIAAGALFLLMLCLSLYANPKK